MDVKQAVQIAKQYVSDLFEGEPITNVGLEEVVYQDESDTWGITVGLFEALAPKKSLDCCRKASQSI